MTIKCSVYIAASVDGFIAQADGDIEWLHNPEYAAPEVEDFGYQAFMSSVDALVMGRASFEKVLSFPIWPYGDKQVIVLSSRPLAVPEPLRPTVQSDGGPPEQVVARLAAAGKQHLYIDGGITIQRFLQAGLINEMTITRIPILLGDGIPLFGAIGSERPLRHITSTPFSNGFLQSTYQVKSS